MYDILGSLSSLLRAGGPFMPLFALLGGLVTSLSPCSLSALPFIIAYIGGGKDRSRLANLGLSATYAAGNALAYGTLGVLSALLGTLINFTGSWWYLLLGILMLVVALEQFDLTDFSRAFVKYGQKVKRNRFGAFVFGVISGIFASPCATPIMLAIMTMIAASNASIWTGLFLFLLFALGNSFTIIIAGLASGHLNLLNKTTYSTFAKVSQTVLGVLIFALGLFLIYQGL